MSYNEETDYFGMIYKGKWYDIVKAGLQKREKVIDGFSFATTYSSGEKAIAFGESGFTSATFTFSSTANGYANAGVVVHGEQTVLINGAGTGKTITNQTITIPLKEEDKSIQFIWGSSQSSGVSLNVGKITLKNY